jgi:hypothetical protein
VSHQGRVSIEATVRWWGGMGLAAVRRMLGYEPRIRGSVVYSGVAVSGGGNRVG